MGRIYLILHINKNHSLISFFLLVTIILYPTFISIDIFSKTTGDSYSVILKYICIIIFFLVSLLIDKRQNAKSTLLLRIALFFTLCADTCLLILKYYKLGIILFSIVQITYIIRHVYISKINKNLLLIPLACIFILSVLLNRIRSLEIDIQLFNLSIIYGIILITSVLVAQKNSRIIALGMLLFLLCDLCVGLSYIFNAYPATIFNISAEYLLKTLIWIFYLPSQFLLTLSGT